VARRHGRGIALLVGAYDAAEFPSDISWENPIPLPSGERRVAVIGRVPRGTVS